MASQMTSQPNDGAAVSVEVEGLSKYYGDFKALDNVSFKVRAGEIVGFLGPNGAGKTTTMKILTCFQGASGGRAKVAGFDVAEQSMEVRQRVGYLPETVPLYENMIVYDYLKFIAEMRRVPGDRIHQSIKETAQVCGLPEMINRPIRELSKGYRQRVGLAQALIHKPEVVILDEPTSGLDPNQLVEIRDLIKEIGQQKTIILSTHILQEVAAVCDRILIIDKGKLVADGSVADLEKRVRREEQYLATFRMTGGDSDALLAALKNVGEVDHIEVLQERGSEATILLVTRRGRDLRHDIFELASREGLVLLELQRERLTLEDIFRALTGDPDEVFAEKRRKILARRGIDSELDNTASADAEVKADADSNDSSEEG